MFQRIVLDAVDKMSAKACALAVCRPSNVTLLSTVARNKSDFNVTHITIKTIQRVKEKGNQEETLRESLRRYGGQPGTFHRRKGLCKYVGFRPTSSVSKGCRHKFKESRGKARPVPF